MKRTVPFLVFLSLAFSNAWADCRDASFADYCGLDLNVETNKSFYAPQESITFIFKLVNSSKIPIYIPASFFEYGLLPCMELSSGKTINFKAIFPAPECEKIPSEGDIVLEAGESFEFIKTRPAYLEVGRQKWSFEGILYECSGIENTMNCEIESNTTGLYVRKFSGWQTDEKTFHRVGEKTGMSAELFPYEEKFHKYFKAGSNSVLGYFESSADGVFWCGPKMNHPNPYSWLFLSVLVLEKTSFQIKVFNTMDNTQETFEFQNIEPGPYRIKIGNLTPQSEWNGRIQFNFKSRVIEERPIHFRGK